MKKSKSKNKGNGIGPHQEVSPMGHSTRTKTKIEKKDQEDRKNKQHGWSI